MIQLAPFFVIKINDFRVELTDISAKTKTLVRCTQTILFPTLNTIFLGYFDPIIIIFDIKNKKIRGELTDR